MKIKSSLKSHLEMTLIATLLIAVETVFAAAPNWDITGTWMMPMSCTYNCPIVPWVHKMEVTFQNPDTGGITGHGGYTDGSTYRNTWDITSGAVSGDGIDFYAHYTLGAPGCTMHVWGTIASDGLSMSGYWSNNCGGESDGTWTATGEACSLTDSDGDGYSVCGGDADDTNAAIHPGAIEVCDGFDNDCDGTVDEDLTAPLADKQYGVCAGSLKACDGINFWTEPDYSIIEDYEDTEVSCDTLDNDCDGTVDRHVCDWNCDPTYEEAPTLSLGVNRYVWKGGDYFITMTSRAKKGRAAFYETQSAFSIKDTNGCSCSQILNRLYEYNPVLYEGMSGHWKYGCNIVVMNEFIRLVT